MLNDPTSFLDMILLPQFLAYHKPYIDKNFTDVSTYRYESPLKERGYRIDFKDSSLQTLWVEWQASMLVVMKSISETFDIISEGKHENKS